MAVPTTTTTTTTTTRSPVNETGQFAAGSDVGPPLGHSPLSNVVPRRSAAYSPSHPPSRPREVICEVSDLYYGISAPAGGEGSVARGIGQRWGSVPSSCWRGLCGKDKRGAVGGVGVQDAPRRALLQGVSCRVRAGDMVAVIGASGAGKSTFLDLLAGRKADGECAGQIFLAEDGAGGRASVYVTQVDFHVAELTVRESLAFAVRLGMGGRDVSDEDRRVRVEELLGVLGLESCGDVRVGNPIERGISGGQARRLSVGVGVADLESVRLLLLDEPTTGLDSSSATEVLNLARRLAAREDRRAVVASVHQPSPEMFALFDKVLVLVDGHQAFFGSVSDASTVLSRPEIGVIPSPGQNPAEFILLAAKAIAATTTSAASWRQECSPERSSSFREVSSDFSEPEPVGAGGIEYLYDDEESEGINSEEVTREGGKQEEREERSRRSGKGSEERGGFTGRLRRAWGGEDAAYAVGFLMQLSAVWSRAWTVQARRKDSLWALFVKNTFVGILTTAVFWQEAAVGTDEPLVDPLLNDATPAASNILGLLYFGTLYGLTGHLQAIPEMFEWKRHFERERAAGMYSTTVYWLVSTTVHIPVLFFGFVIYQNLVYWTLGLPADLSKYLVFGASGLLSTLTGYSMSQTLAAALETPQGAFATWPIIVVIAANFAGFTVRLPAVRVWFRWLCELSFCRWLYQIVVVNEFEDFDEGTQLLDLYFGGNRPSLVANGAIALLFYAASLLGALFFLNPRRSRLRILEETPVASPGEVAPGGTDHGRSYGSASSREGVEVGVAVLPGLRKNSKDPGLLETTVGDGDDCPLYYLEEGERETPTGSTATATDNSRSTLRTPLLAGASAGRLESIHGAGVREGSRVAFLNIHYYVYLRGGDSGGGGGKAGATSSAGTVAAKRGKREAHVLRGVTGVAFPGQMMAILGPSGSGKTTLLDLIGGRKTLSVGRQEGDIIVDGVLTRAGDRRGSSSAGTAYVMQDNVHHSALTVRQTLAFAAKLRMSCSATARDRKRRVTSMVTMLGLEGILDTKVGSESNRGISGGEMKRLSIAVEAMDLPGLLLLDEPTSGLDATTALEVLTGVRGLADLGRTVVVSLHQPSAEMFELFDTCLLLARGGSQAYCGRADGAMAYFASIRITPPPGADTNPADFLLSIASFALPPAEDTQSPFSAGIAAATTTGDVPAAETASSGGFGMNEGDGSGGVALDLRVGHVGIDVGGSHTASHAPELGHASTFVPPDPAWNEDSRGGGDSVGPRPVSAAELESAFAASAAASAVRADAEREVGRVGGGGDEMASRRPRGGERGKKRSTFWLSLVLTEREFITTWQDLPRIVTALARHAFVGAFYGSLWWRLGLGRVSERVGAIFFSLVFVILGNQQNIPRVFQDRLLFYREKGAGVYGAVEYWWSIVIAQIPLAALTTVVYGVLLYFMAGLNTNGPEPFGYFIVVIVLCNLIGLSFCQMLAAATRLEDTAVALFPVFLFFFIAFSGFIVRLPTLPEYLSSWAPTVSFARWAMEGLVINEFDGNEEAIFPIPSGVPITPQQLYAVFLKSYGFGETHWRGEGSAGTVLWILLGNLVFFRLMGLFFLKYVTFERR